MDLPAGLSIFDLTGQVALVTGAGRGLGREVALTLASAGADLVLASRTGAELETLAQEIRALGRRALAVPTDVTDEQAVEALVAAALTEFGRIDILVNNAGINIRGPLVELAAADWDAVVGVNLRAYFLMCRAAGRVMTRQGYGRVINMTSVLAAVGLAGVGAYAASKGAVAQLTRVLAIEWARSGVTVNCLGPTYIETDLTRPLFDDPARKAFIEERTPLGRWGQPEELRGAVIFLASPASGLVTGQTLYVDGGWLAW